LPLSGADCQLGSQLAGPPRIPTLRRATSQTDDSSCSLATSSVVRILQRWAACAWSVPPACNPARRSSGRPRLPGRSSRSGSHSCGGSPAARSAFPTGRSGQRPCSLGPPPRTWWGCGRPRVADATFCYRRSLWERHPFPDTSDGSDTGYLWEAPAKRVGILWDASFYVALLHRDNTSSAAVEGPGWRSCPPGQIAWLMGNDWALYQTRDLTVYE